MRKNEIMQFFKYDHLPEKLAAKSKPFAELAKMIDESVPNCAEKSAGLRKLLEAKDCVVRCMVYSKQPENEAGQKDMGSKNE